MKINFTNYIEFQKKYCTALNIKSDNKPIPVQIYKLDNKDDIADFEKAKKLPIWANNWYLSDLAFNFTLKHQRSSFYVMENTKNEPICFAQVIDDSTKFTSLQYIETAPIYSKQNKANRKLKYIGETMIAYFVKEALKNGKKEFIVPAVADRKPTCDFYFEQCKMKKTPSGGAKLDRGDFDKFLSKNSKHTN